MHLKANAEEFQAALRRHNRGEVYHWTPARRLPSVLAHGILCRRELDTGGIPYDPHGYGGYGKEEDFAGHVCVSFFPHKGMMRNEAGPPAIIELPSRVVIAEGAFYCPENTAKSEYDFETSTARTEVEHLDELFVGPDEWRLIDWQAEVWIPDGIPVRDFRRVLFRNNDELAETFKACQGIELDRDGDLPFAVGKAWQFPSPPVDLAVVELDIESISDPTT